MTVSTSHNNNSSSQQSATSIADLITEFHKCCGDIPPLLIGATTTCVNSNVYLFGGRLQSTREISNQMYILSLETKEWKRMNITHAPTARYFHSANYNNKNHILYYGGMSNSSSNNELITLSDLVLFNLLTLSWEYPKNDFKIEGRYAHISSCIKNRLIIIGGQDIEHNYLNDVLVYDINKQYWNTLSTEQYQYGAYRSTCFAITANQFISPSFVSTVDIYDENNTTNINSAHYNNDILLYTYTNFNSTNVTRQLHIWKINNKNELIEMTDESHKLMTGNSLPPPLRFPSGFMCGQQFILAGAHMSSTAQQYQTWALDLTTFIWTKIEAGNVLKGSWLRGLLYEDKNQFLIFGNQQRSMEMDYKDRVQSFDNMACVNIEIFGIYKPPKLSYNTAGQGLGLYLLKDHTLSNLKIVTIDNQFMMVNSAILASRWKSIQQLNIPQDNTEDCELYFPDSYVILLGFLQFIYTDHLGTVQQHQPYILARLLFIADLFDIPRLKELSIHALHQMLNIQTASMIYEAAILSNAISLQIRALRVLLNAKKLFQRQKQQQLHSQQQLHLQQQQQQQQQGGNADDNRSTFLQKYEQQQQEHKRNNSLTASSSSFASTTTGGNNNAMVSSNSVKLSKLRARQYSNDILSDHSPLSSTSSSPKLTPTNSSNNSNGNKSSFWRTNNNTTVAKKPLDSNRPPVTANTLKSDIRLGSFNFLNNHN